MKYVLITKLGKVMPFYILKVAELYLSLYGGTIIDNTLVFTQQTENIT